MKLTITRHSLFWLTAAALLFFWVPPAQAVRIKDIATFSGVRDNQLIALSLAWPAPAIKKIPYSPSVP